MEAYACATSSNSTENENIRNMPRMVNKSIYPSDGVYYFKDGGTRLKAEVKNTRTQLRIRLIDDPPFFRDARLDRYMYRTPKKTLVYEKPKLMPNGSYRHQTAHALMVWNDGDFTLYAGREGVPTLFEKGNKQDDGVKERKVRWKKIL